MSNVAEDIYQINSFDSIQLFNLWQMNQYTSSVSEHIPALLQSVFNGTKDVGCLDEIYKFLDSIIKALSNCDILEVEALFVGQNSLIIVKPDELTKSLCESGLFKLRDAIIKVATFLRARDYQRVRSMLSLFMNQDWSVKVKFDFELQKQTLLRKRIPELSLYIRNESRKF